MLEVVLGEVAVIIGLQGGEEILRLHANYVTL